MDDFYVEPNECMFCGAPPAAAPNLMGMRINESGHEECYFKRQPANDEDVEEAIAGMSASCCGAVQYRGSDPRILVKIGKAAVIPFRGPVFSLVGIGVGSDRQIISTPNPGLVARLLARFR